MWNEDPFLLKLLRQCRLIDTVHKYPNNCLDISVFIECTTVCLSKKKPKDFYGNANSTHEVNFVISTACTQPDFSKKKQKKKHILCFLCVH